ncbi:MAG TPA: hypothetical protein ENN20_07180 [Candidatus Marinimicrobia bacterium]|nr:hypothetical protein [Candidatus Neomarinimicrobiota bacterium]
MTDKFNISKKKTKLPFDAKIDEKCEKCSGNIVYRSSSYFGKKTYFKICNGCGWYELLDAESWKQAITENSQINEDDID